MKHMRIWSLLSFALSISSLTSGASAETVGTTDGTFTVIEAVAPLGTSLEYVSGGNGLVGSGNTWPVPGTSADAMNNYDHVWLQFPDSILMKTSDGSSLNEVFAIPGTDHDPFPYENLEFRIWGSDVSGSLDEEGRIGAIYRDGFDTTNTFLGHSDDYTSLWTFQNSYSYFMITGGSHFDRGDFNINTEGEIDGLARSAAVPEASSVLLLASGLVGLALRNRKQAK